MVPEVLELPEVLVVLVVQLHPVVQLRLEVPEDLLVLLVLMIR
jgi:hypothetical protein